MSAASEELSLVRCTTPVDLAAFEIPHRDPFVCELRIGGQQLSESVLHVSNVEYLRWLDRAAELHADHLGYTRQRMLDQGVMWFVARHEIDYLAEAWPDDDLLVATWVRDMQRVRSWREYVVIRPADETVLCRAATLWVFVDLATRRPARIPDQVARRFEPLSLPGGAQRCTSR